MYDTYDRFLATHSETIIVEAQKDVLCSEAPVARANGMQYAN
jgi:hypothetical protein